MPPPLSTRPQHRGASVHNGEYEEEVEDAKELTVEQAQENDAVMNKMKSLRAKMENLTLQSKIPRPPSRPKSTSKRRVASVRNVRGSMNTMSRVEPLPPVRGSLERDKKLETIEPADLLSNPGTRSRSGPQVRHSSSQGELEGDRIQSGPKSLLEDHMGPATSSQRVPSTLPSQPDSGSAAERLGLGTAPDARVVTDLVNQANREGKINNIVRTSQRDPLTGLSSSRARISPSPAVLNRVFNGSASVHRSSERLSTPEARQALISAHSMRGRLSGGRDGRIAVSPVCRLPPVVNSSISPKKKSSKRCYLCNKKTGLATSYQCRCGHNYCASHRYAEAHSCGFDYKSEGRKLLEQNNPLVSAPKLPKI
ncbi:putative AN1-type zinc finger protein 4 [Apostichopus japonicus]|uniref:Putative AN1-type zinc finger protein 4 n=1 Tax=Stichopus japonicus TaxID=307972 RepID=A0A2G8JKE3_STIJA|nr:putative AN1-type zinc finger protein 4 [Apostichopus japonicus]